MPELLSSRSFFAVALGLAAVTFAVYAPALKFQFVLDDHRYTGDPRIQNSGHVWEYFANYVWAQFTGGPPSFYRPLFILWLRINFIINSLSPWGWHFLSITMHLAVAGLLGLLVYTLLRDRVAALLAVTLFALHPAQTESVALISVPDPLMSTCILGAVMLYLRHVAALPGGEARGKRSRKAARKKTGMPAASWWLIASGSACFAALLVKETAMVLPAVIFALAWFMPRGNAGLRATEKIEDAGFKTRLVRAIRETLPFVGVTAVYLLMRRNAFGGKLGSLTQHLPWSTVLLSWPATLWFYVKVLLWPVRSHSFADPMLAERLSLNGVLLPALGLGCAIAILVGGFFWAWRKAQRELRGQEAVGVKYALLIGTLLLVLPILPALHLNALNPGDFLHGRYTYLPSAGLMLLVAAGWHLAGRMRVPLLFACSLLALVFAGFAVSQEQQWKDDLTIYTVAHALAPHNAPVNQNLANARVQVALQQADDGRCSDAMPVFEQVSREYPQDWYAWAGLGICFVQVNDLAKAEESLHRAADLSHNSQVMQQWQELRASMGLPRSAPSN
ncbi:MAG: tetratricopeptide repeat protein [Terriglobales bacterium]